MACSSMSSTSVVPVASYSRVTVGSAVVGVVEEGAGPGDAAVLEHDVLDAVEAGAAAFEVDEAVVAADDLGELALAAELARVAGVDEIVAGDGGGGLAGADRGDGDAELVGAGEDLGAADLHGAAAAQLDPGGGGELLAALHRARGEEADLLEEQELLGADAEGLPHGPAERQRHGGLGDDGLQRQGGARCLEIAGELHELPDGVDDDEAVVVAGDREHASAGQGPRPSRAVPRRRATRGPPGRRSARPPAAPRTAAASARRGPGLPLRRARWRRAARRCETCPAGPPAARGPRARPPLPRAGRCSGAARAARARRR